MSITVVNQLPPQFNQRVSLAFAGTVRRDRHLQRASRAVRPGPITIEAAHGRLGHVHVHGVAPRHVPLQQRLAAGPADRDGARGALIVYPADGPAGVRRRAPTTRRKPGRLAVRPGVPVLPLRDGLGDPRPGRAAGRRRPSTILAGWPTTSRTTGSSTGATRPTRWPRPTCRACRRSPTTRCARSTPGDRVLMRVVGGGHDMHPFHHHGQHARIIAVDGFPLDERPGTRVRPVARGLHDPVAAGPDRGRDSSVDRQGPRLGHLRRTGATAHRQLTAATATATRKGSTP